MPPRRPQPARPRKLHKHIAAALWAARSATGMLRHRAPSPHGLPRIFCFSSVVFVFNWAFLFIVAYRGPWQGPTRAQGARVGRGRGTLRTSWQAPPSPPSRKAKTNKQKPKSKDTNQRQNIKKFFFHLFHQCFEFRSSCHDKPD